MTKANGKPKIVIRAVHKRFRTKKSDVLVLEGVNLEVRARGR